MGGNAPALRDIPRTSVVAGAAVELDGRVPFVRQA